MKILYFDWMFNPFLFSLFLNDIDTFLENKNITGLQTISDEIENNLDIYHNFLFCYMLMTLHC